MTEREAWKTVSTSRETGTASASDEFLRPGVYTSDGRYLGNTLPMAIPPGIPAGEIHLIGMKVDEKNGRPDFMTDEEYRAFREAPPWFYGKRIPYD